MPTYEYACDACEHEFEREQRITEAPIRTCPACGKPRARRLISRTSFVLKGGGWYSDLYSASPRKEAAKADGEAGGESRSEPKSGAAGDEKPAAAASAGASGSAGSGRPGKGKARSAA
jgi:putative FmdB family regulatory protein